MNSSVYLRPLESADRFEEHLASAHHLPLTHLHGFRSRRFFDRNPQSMHMHLHAPLCPRESPSLRPQRNSLPERPLVPIQRPHAVGIIAHLKPQIIHGQLAPFEVAGAFLSVADFEVEGVGVHVFI